MKNTNLLKYAITLVVLLAVSCNKDDDMPKSNGYTKTVIPTDINDLFVGKGTATQDTVIVYSEGGPEVKVLAEDLEEITQFSKYYRVYPRQAQHLNQSINKNEITFEQAIKEDAISTDIFQKVVQHFKDEGKYVVAMSHSFGSFILPNVIDKYPNTPIDKVIIMAGRLDMPEVVWQGFRDGHLYNFPDGVTPTSDDDSSPKGNELSGPRLQAGLGMNRYTQLLADNDLTNWYYVWGEKDQEVGALSKEEKDFLISKNVDGISITEGDHGSMFQDDVFKLLLEHIRK